MENEDGAHPFLRLHRQVASQLFGYSLRQGKAYAVPLVAHRVAAPVERLEHMRLVG